MSQFELSCLVNRLRLRPWAVIRVSWTRSQTFAIEFMLQLYHKAGWRAVRRTNTVRKLWERRLKELLGRGLWTLDANGCTVNDERFNMERFLFSYRRCLFCRPSYLYYKRYDKTRAINYQIRPCWRNHICPFCAARVMAAQYRYVKHWLNKQLRTNANHTELVAYCRVARVFVPAVDFAPHMGCEPEHIGRLSAPLRQAIVKQKSAYAALTKKLQRHTVGSLWRLVVIPTDDGWFLDVRQFLVCPVGVTPPFVRSRAFVVTYFKRLRVTRRNKQPREFEDLFYKQFGEFCRYPLELLKGPCELTAAYLKATHDVRLASGTGVFRRTGKVLIRFFKQLDLARREYKRGKKEAAAGLCPDDPQAAQTHAVDDGAAQAGAIPVRLPVPGQLVQIRPDAVPGAAALPPCDAVRGAILATDAGADCDENKRPV